MNQYFLFPEFAAEPFQKKKQNDYTQVGQVGEAYVLFRLRSFGYKVYSVSEGLPYDLIADVNNVLIRVQVKTTQQANCGRLKFIGWRGRYAKTGSHGASKEKYKDNECDVFAYFAMSLEKAFFKKSEGDMCAEFSASYFADSDELETFESAIEPILEQR